MARPKIIAHCLIKNEERFIWYALQSVLPFVDKIMVWDTGSTDKTVDIIKTINSSLVELKQFSSVDALSHTEMRRKMLKSTKGFDWGMVLDGDEIWPESAWPAIYKAMENPKTNSIAVHTINFVGDIFHRLPESAGQYQIAGERGHLNLRFYRLDIPGLDIVNPHGGQTYVINGQPLQDQHPPAVGVFPRAYFNAPHFG
jgi:glycosyltransferase involved in cell wall biosynthesis